MKYAHRVCLLDGNIVETVIDLSKVVAVRRAGNRELSHKVYCTGLREPIGLFDSPARKAESSEEYVKLAAVNYSLLIEAWKQGR